MKDFSNTWQQMLEDTFLLGKTVSPRGQQTLEIPQRTIEVDMRRPILLVRERNLNYRFMAAEAQWILDGDDRVETISPFNANIAKFSDDGKTFFGAYGPKISGQMHYVLDKLREDPDTRQAGLTIWRESPPATKDVPCTIAIFFSIRGEKLNAHVFMRSSDIWLGIPYDVFNFSMLAHQVCAYLNYGNGYRFEVSPGTLYLTAASSHLYEQNWPDAKICLVSKNVRNQIKTPEIMHQDPLELQRALHRIKNSKAGDSVRWWGV